MTAAKAAPVSDLMTATVTPSVKDKWALKNGDALFTKDSKTPD